MIHISGSTLSASHEPPGRSGVSHNSHATHSSASMQMVIAAVRCVMRKCNYFASFSAVSARRLPSVMQSFLS